MFNFIDRVERFFLKLGAVSGFATLLIMITVCVDVVGRSLFNAPLHAGVETSELLLVSIVFFGLAAAQQRRQNFAIDILNSVLPKSVQRFLEYLGLLLCLIIVVVMAWPSSVHALTSFNRNEMGFSLVAFPIWPARILIALGFWLLAAQFAFDLLRLIFNQPRKIEPQSELEGLIE